MKVKGESQKLITVVATDYVDRLVVPDLLPKSFDVYKKRDFKSRIFHVAVSENTYATAGIVLTVLGIEAYRNRIYYLEKKKAKRNVAEDLSGIIEKKVKGNSNLPTFPKQKFQDILTEVFVARDVIVHNHIYEVEVFRGKDYEMLGHRQKLLPGYGDKKLANSVNSRTRKTKLLKFNVQPGKIGFEDLYTLLAFFDLFVGICQKVLGYGHVPFKLAYKLNNNWEDNLSKILAHYYEQIPNKNYIKQFDRIIEDFKNAYSPFLAKAEIWQGKEELMFDKKYVVRNSCPQCGTFGFNKPNERNVCHKCKFKILVR